MPRIAIVNSQTLLGRELKEALEHRPDLNVDLRLLTADPEENGTVADIAGAATLIQQLSPETLKGVEMLFVCPGPEVADKSLPTLNGPTVVHLSPRHPIEGSLPIVAGVNLDRAAPDALIVSPHPAAVALAHLLHPLRALGLEEAIAWVMLPTSASGQEGIDELLGQTQSILSFRTDLPKTVFGRQLAFNFFPAEDSGDEVASVVEQVLDHDVSVSAQLIQGSVFHSLAVGVHVRLGADVPLGTVQDELRASPYLDLGEGQDALGPIDVAGRETLLIGSIELRPGLPGAFWLWGAMDNLTLGGAANAVAIVEALVAPTN
jgi:aspartate-semialdehyde dehydrogenase